MGPHPVAMFEVNVFTPAQFGAFVSWLAIWRGPLSVLVHPNTTEPETEMSHAQRETRNHTQRAIWMGERYPVDTSLFKMFGQVKTEDRKPPAPAEVSAAAGRSGDDA